MDNLDQLEKELKKEFPTHPYPNYVEEVAQRFETNMDAVEANREALQNVMVEANGVRVGHRFRMEDGLYEVTLIQEGPQHGEPRVTIAKVLDTKVSEAFGNVHGIYVSDLKEAPEFEEYNEIVNKAYELSE